MPFSSDDQLAWLGDFLKRRGLPGMAVAVTNREGECEFLAKGWAELRKRPIEEDTLFELGSIGKTFTAVITLQLADEGLLSLDAPVTDYLPWFEVRSDTQANLHAVWGTDGAIFAAGEKGTILRSDDGGKSFAPAATGLDVPLRGIWGGGANDVFVVGTGATLVRGSGGRWTKQTATKDRESCLQALGDEWGRAADVVKIVEEYIAALPEDTTINKDLVKKYYKEINKKKQQHLKALVIHFN